MFIASRFLVTGYNRSHRPITQHRWGCCKVEYPWGYFEGMLHATAVCSVVASRGGAFSPQSARLYPYLPPVRRKNGKKSTIFGKFLPPQKHILPPQCPPPHKNISGAATEYATAILRHIRPIIHSQLEESGLCMHYVIFSIDCKCSIFSWWRSALSSVFRKYVFSAISSR